MVIYSNAKIRQNNLTRCVILRNVYGLQISDLATGVWNSF